MQNSKRKLLFLFVLLFFKYGLIFSASTKCIISGRIADKKTSLPIKDVNVFVQEIGVGTTTDADGRYELHLPAGEFTISITHIGFKTWKQKVNLQKTHPQEEINVELEPAILQLPQISVKEKREGIEISHYALKKRPLHNMPSPLPDVLLTL